MSRPTDQPLVRRLQCIESDVARLAYRFDRLEWRVERGLEELNDVVRGLESMLDRMDRRQRPYGDGTREQWTSRRPRNRR